MHYLLLAAFLWGTSFIAGKVAYETFDPALTVTGRLVIASIVLLPITLSFFNKYSIGSTDTTKQKNITYTNVAWLVLLGVLTYPLTFMLQFIGLEMTSASSAVTVLGLMPIVVMIVGALFFKQKLTWQVLLLGVIACAGVALLVGVAGLENVSLLGCFLVFLSTIVVGFWMQLSKKMLGVIEPQYYTVLTIQLGTLASLPVMLMMVQNWDINITVTGMVSLAYLGIGCSFLAGWLWNKGLQTNAANQSSVFFALEPVFGVLMAVMFLGEHLNAVSIAGICLVLFAAVVASVLPQKQ